MKKYISIILIILIIGSAVVGIVSIVASHNKISKEKNEKQAEVPKELEENKKLLEEKRKKREIELKNKYQSPKYRKELERLNKKIEINPNNAELYFERGNILKILCESKKAYSDYTKAIELSKKSKYYIARAGILRFNNERQVYSDIEKAIEISKDAETYEGIWDVYWFCGDWDNATKCVQEAIKLNPQKVELYIKRVETERVNPIVISLCDEYLKKFPNEYRFYILKMNAMVDLEENIDKTEIEKMLTKGNRMTKGEIYNEIGRIEFHNKNYPKAIENYDKAIEYDLKNKPKDVYGKLKVPKVASKNTQYCR